MGASGSDGFPAADGHRWGGAQWPASAAGYDGMIDDGENFVARARPYGSQPGKTAECGQYAKSRREIKAGEMERLLPGPPYMYAGVDMAGKEIMTGGRIIGYVGNIMHKGYFPDG